jgi:hypothetical protein
MIEAVLSYLVLAITIAAGITIVYSTLKNGISPLPTGPKAKKMMLQVLDEYKPTGQILELGSGWGTLTSALARAFPACRVTGYENSIAPFLISKCIQWSYRNPNLRLEYGDFLTVPLSQSDIVVCYLCGELMIKLREKLERELKWGTIIISHTFAVPGWEPHRIEQVDDFFRSKIYVYFR